MRLSSMLLLMSVKVFCMFKMVDGVLKMAENGALEFR